MGKNVALIGWLVAAATLLVGGAADTETVGDGLGWTIPPGGDVAYRTWAAGQDFELGDTIIFNWSGTHNVVEVSKEGYDQCNATNNLGLGPVQTTSPYTFTLNSTNPHYFICTVANHCSLGQKVTIQRRDSSAAPPAATAVAAFFFAIATYISLFM